METSIKSSLYYYGYSIPGGPGGGGSSVYYDGYGSYNCRNNLLPIKPFKEVEKKSYLENLTTKKNEHRIKCII